MSGHSKWSTIKHKKGILDAKRGKIFSKLLKEITVAVQLGGKSPDSNPRLRLVLYKAKLNNVPKDNIERAIKRGAGELDSVHYEEFTYEGYGPGGTAIMLDVLTDNKNRTTSEIRHIFTKSGNNLADAGSVSWDFQRVGVVVFPSDVQEDTLLEQFMDYNILDIKSVDKEVHLYFPLDDTEALEERLKELYPNLQLDWERIAKNQITIDNKKDALALIQFLDQLDDQDDIQKIHTNAFIPEHILEEIEKENA